MIDPQQEKVLDGVVVLIEGDRIEAVGADLAVPNEVEVIDLGNRTLLPGLIDVHVHITSQSGDYYADKFRRSPIDEAVTAHVYARRTLEAGFTSVRSVGSAEFIDVALRNAINRGIVVGPRIQAATLAISATGGHGDLSGFSPYLRFEQMSNIADGIDEIRKLVRFEIKHGADLIKITAGAGVLSEEESVGAPQYSQEELDAAVEEAAMWGRKVAAHAHGTEAIKRAIRAGVASVEHAGLIDEEGVRLALERGTYLVPDVYTDLYILEHAEEMGLPDMLVEKEKELRRHQTANWGRAIKAGVKFAFGTDAAVFPHGTNANQFVHLVELGFTPMDAIQMATVNAADLMGWSDQVGSIAADHYADIIAVEGNPLEDISELERVGFVMKGGVVYKEP
jgi:imidazolonepropionase-like amidohydrolase